ncbi:hypothetical protein IMCC3135_10235 [Granulosicoccus antarcticus IMCC3135]|uniref:DUF2189 domain-containing protein n=2 Tax=Granulosicoccus TaxID=437504 RepID=A0A2Z2NQ91_9GAMM|nr:hypothetical protein IMCC3135_10235 [Granulosicoccus antarcticus IMCC3135]
MVTHEYVKKTSEARTPVSSQESGLQKGSAMSVNRVRTLAASEWLVQAAMDIHASRYQSLLYGLFFVLMGLGIDSAHEGNAAFAIGLSAAFMFTGPFLSIGLYELSRQIQEGEKLDLWLSMFSWCKNPAAVGRFAFYLSVVMVAWLWLSTVLMAALHQPSGMLFAAFLLSLWAALAIVVFMASVVAIPMMLDRPVSAAQAVRFSLRCCRLNAWALCLWASIVACGVGLSLALGYWPLLLVGPLLGHATWHAYRDMLGCQYADMPTDSGKA